jgi:hypothetical protein
MHIQYVRWIGGILLRGDFGSSLWQEQSVIAEILSRLPTTFQLGIMALFFTRSWRALRRSTFPSLSAWERGFKGGQSESLSPWERGPEDRLGVAADVPLAAAGAATLTTWLVHGLFDFFYPFLPVALVYWAILGLTAALARDGDR